MLRSTVTEGLLVTRRVPDWGPLVRLSTSRYVLGSRSIAVLSIPSRLLHPSVGPRGEHRADLDIVNPGGTSGARSVLSASASEAVLYHPTWASAHVVTVRFPLIAPHRRETHDGARSLEESSVKRSVQLYPVLLSVALVAACTSDTSEGVTGNTELNLDIVNPGGTSGELGFTVDRVDYRITCAGNTPGSYPIPDADTSGTDYNYSDSVDISGAFEVVDTRVPPVWQAVMDLPPGNCTVTLSVYEQDEIVCVGSQTLAINEDATTKYDIVLVCSLSIDTPDGMADIDGSFEFITGNLCPKLYVLNAIPSFATPNGNNPYPETDDSVPRQGSGQQLRQQLRPADL